MSCQDCGSKTARLRQVTDVLIRDLVNSIQKSQMYLNVPIPKKSFETLRGRNLHLAKSKKCERGSENERPADVESTSTVTDNNLHSSNTSRLSVVTDENTAKISFIRIPVQMSWNRIFV